LCSYKDNKPSSFNYQPTNIINTQKLIFTTNKDKAWQRFKEFIKNYSFKKPDPLSHWKEFAKILSSFNSYKKGGSGYDLLYHI
jgi:hypothetical protein